MQKTNNILIRKWYKWEREEKIKLKEETDFFNEKVRLDLKENLSDGIIEKEDIFKIAKEYYNIKKIEEILDRIDGKESTKLKEFEKAKEKANDREID